MPQLRRLFRLSTRQQVTRRNILMILVAAVSASPDTTSAGNASTSRRTPTVIAVESCRDAVVNIHGRKTITEDESGQSPGDGPRRVNGMGTGVIIDHRGYILTNHHVVQGVRRIQVTLSDRRTYTARLVAHDHSTDLAIIKIDVKESLPLINIGTSRDLMSGESVIALGNAYGYHHTVTVGIISALNRSVQVSDDQRYHDLIQTDASINPGNSGGPLLNIDGEMIGINAAVRVGAQGIGFAIPVDRAMEIAESLLRAEHGLNLWRGMEGEMTKKDQGRIFKVHSVRRESYAGKAGIRSGDVIKVVNGVDIFQGIDMERALIDVGTGATLEIELERKDVPTEVSLVVGRVSRHNTPLSDETWRVLGMKLTPVKADQLRQTASRYRGGLKVTEVRDDSPAEDARIRQGDILVGMHVWETTSLENMDYILKQGELKKGDPVKFYIVRGDEFLFGHMPAIFR